MSSRALPTATEDRQTEICLSTEDLLGDVPFLHSEASEDLVGDVPFLHSEASEDLVGDVPFLHSEASRDEKYGS